MGRSGTDYGCLFIEWLYCHAVVVHFFVCPNESTIWTTKCPLEADKEVVVTASAWVEEMNNLAQQQDVSNEVGDTNCHYAMLLVISTAARAFCGLWQRRVTRRRVARAHDGLSRRTLVRY